MEAARAAIAKEKGEAALEPWSLSYSIAGDTEKALDPYFAFENAVDVWARTFAGLGIKCAGLLPHPHWSMFHHLIFKSSSQGKCL